MTRVADYIARYFYNKGIRKAFMVTGGGAMHLNDSIARVVPFEVFFHHHEQACSIAAEGLYRACGEVGLVNVTTGPGGLNTLTGVLGQWTDSIPAIYLSGQVKFETTVASCRDLRLRQLGDQEVDIIPIVKNITKYAVSITDPLQLKYELDKAYSAAMTGRMGPVWIDVPMNIQGALVDENSLKGYEPDPAKIEEPNLPFQDILSMIGEAKRPVIVAGHGIRLAGVIPQAMSLFERLRIPVLSTFNGFDLIPSDYPLFAGRIGSLGSRAGNFALQNADLALILGSRNNIRQVSYNWSNFAHRAKKIVVDIDGAELAKPLVRPDLAVHADLSNFIPGLLAAVEKAGYRLRHDEWVSWARERLFRYPVVQKEHYAVKEKIHPYAFVETLTKALEEDAVVVAGNGTACVVLFQAGIVKKGQRVFWNSGCASMGYDLPAAIGAARSQAKRVWCIAGDGSIQMNLQELAVVARYKLPIIIVYLNNQGYSSIRQMQKNFFGKEYGCSTGTGLGFPDIHGLADAYGIAYRKSATIGEAERELAELKNVVKPTIWEIELIPDYGFEPKVTSERLATGEMVAKPLEDMFPFLPRSEFAENMISD